MPITVECEGCLKKYKVPDERAGSVIRCKECGEKIAIPNEEEEEVVRRPVKKKVGKKKKSSGSIGLIIGLAAGGLLFVGGVVIGLVLLLGRGGRNAPLAGGPADPAGGAAANGAAPGGGPAKWSFTPDAPKSAVNWPNQPPNIDGLRGSLDDILIPSSPSPFAVVGTKGSQDVCRVINLATGETVGKFSTPRPEFSGREQALHPDGTQILCAGRFEASQPRKVQVWDVKQGSLLKEFPIGPSDASLQWLDFGPNGEVLTIHIGKFDGKYGHQLTMTNAADGKEIRHIALLGGCNPNSEAFSANRKFLAIAHGVSAPLAIYDLTTGSIAGQIPSGELGSSATVNGMSFSPDGGQLAVLASSSRTPTVSLFDMKTGDRKAQVKFPADSIQLAVRSSSGSTPGLQWLPDGSGWLVAGDLIVDRETSRVLWKVITEKNNYNLSNTRLRFPTTAGIWSVDGPDDGGKLTLIPAPWTAARELIAKQSAETNLVRPGAAATMVLTIGEVRFAEKDEAMKQLATALTDRVQADQLTLGENQPLVLRATYTEAAGETLQEFKQELGKPGANPLGTATGKSVESTNSVLELSWTDAGGQTVYWTHRHAIDQTSAFTRGDLTKEAVRNQMFEGLIASIATLPLPYYLTADQSGPQLPLIHRLPRW